MYGPLGSVTLFAPAPPYSDNVFRNNTIVENAEAGVLFRQEDEPMGAHRNLIEGNRIVDNGGGGPSGAAVVITGRHNDVVFRQDTIGNAKAGGPAKTGIYVGKDAEGFTDEDNRFTHVRNGVKTGP